MTALLSETVFHFDVVSGQIIYDLVLIISPLQMGLSPSFPENDMTYPYHPKEWTLVSRNMQFQLWQNKITSKKYLSYPLDLTQQDPMRNMEIYQFRKANNHELIAPEMILENSQDHICMQDHSYHLLLENIPTRLSHVNQWLSVQERLSILAVIFSALQTLMTKFGPVFLTENMIGFTETGKIKIWINENLSDNNPSFLSPQGLPLHNNSFEMKIQIEKRMFQCISQVFRIAGNWKTDTFPLDFREEAVTICTFEEGQNFIREFCRQNDVRLGKAIPFWKYLQKNKQINLISANPEHYNTPRDQNLRSATSLRNSQTSRYDFSEKYSEKKKNKVTVLESVIHNDSNQLFANFEAVNGNSPRLPPISPKLLPKRRSSQEFKINVTNPVQKSAPIRFQQRQDFSFAMKEPPSPDTVRRSEPKIMKYPPKNNQRPPLSPKKMVRPPPTHLSHPPQFNNHPSFQQPPRNNPAIRFQSPTPAPSPKAIQDDRQLKNIQNVRPQQNHFQNQPRPPSYPPSQVPEINILPSISKTEESQTFMVNNSQQFKVENREPKMPVKVERREPPVQIQSRRRQEERMKVEKKQPEKVQKRQAQISFRQPTQRSKSSEPQVMTSLSHEWQPPYNPANVGEAQAYIKQKYGKYLTESPKKKQTNHKQQLLLKYLDKSNVSSNLNNSSFMSNY